MVPSPVSVLEKVWNALYGSQRFLELHYPDHYDSTIKTTLALQISGHEGLCEGFNYKLQLITYGGTVKLQDWLGKSIGVGFKHDHDGERFICGFVRSVKQITPDAFNVLYELEIVDFLTLLKARQTWRIFQGLSVYEITKKILDEHRHTNLDVDRAFGWTKGEGFHLSYPARDFVLQAGESDHDFLTRLWRQEGIVWHYTHEIMKKGQQSQPVHTLHFSNSPRYFKPGAAPVIRYHPDASVQGRDTITHWQGWRTLSTKYVSRSHSEYKIFDTRRETNQSPLTQGREASRFAELTFADHQHDPAHFSETWKHLKDHTANLALHHQYKSKGFQGQSGVRAMMVGTTFELEWHDSQEDREFLTTRMDTYAQNNLNLEAYQLGSLYAEWQAQGDVHTTPSEAPVYINRFDCVRKSITVIPAYDPSRVPNIGPMTATVVTRDKAEVDVDDMGRILVKFAFTRPQDHQADGFNPLRDQPNLDDTQGREWTARLRVLQPWAHNTYGSAFYPRKGEEVLIQFINNHPDNPIVVGSVHNGHNKNTSFHGKSLVERDLISGIRSKEHEAWRHNHLQFDDTAKQISTQLHSDHAYTQLSQGYLTSPRSDWQNTKPRGDGFELRTDESGAIRTAKGLLISAFERLKARGKQLSIEETQALMAESLTIFTQLGQYAQQHMGLPSDTTGHQDLQSKLQHWEQGSNTAPNGTAGGSPVIAITAPAGLIQNTPETLAQQAGKNIDSIAHKNHQVTSGQNAIVNAGHGIGLFAQAKDLKTIAHRGKWIAQAQHNDAELQAGQNINISASNGKVKIVANQEITLITGDGTYLTLGNGKFTVGTSGTATIHAAKHSLKKTSTSSADLPSFEQGTIGRKPKLNSGLGAWSVDAAQFDLDGSTSAPPTGQTSQGKVQELLTDTIEQHGMLFAQPLKQGSTQGASTSASNTSGEAEEDMEVVQYFKIVYADTGEPVENMHYTLKSNNTVLEHQMPLEGGTTAEYSMQDHPEELELKTWVSTEEQAVSAKAEAAKKAAVKEKLQAMPTQCAYVKPSGDTVEATDPKQFDAIRTTPRLSEPRSIPYQFPGSSSPQDALEYTSNVQGKNIKIIAPKSGVSPTGKPMPSAESTVKALGVLQKNQAAAIDRVVISPNANPDDAYWAEKYNDPSFESAATGGNGNVTFYPSETAETQAAMDSTMIHESGHNFQQALNKKNPNLAKEWAAAIKKDGAAPSDYANNSPGEDFAETSVMHSLSKGTECEGYAKAKYPARYEFFDKIMK